METGGAPQLEVRQRGGGHQRHRDDRRDGDRAPVRTGAPQAPGRCDNERRISDEKRDEHAVVAATQGLRGHHQAEHHASARGWPVREAMEREHRERDAGGRQKLDVRQMREDERHERERDAGDERGAAIARQVPHQIVGAGQ